MNDKIIVSENKCKLTNATQVKLAKLNNVDFFPLSTIAEQQYIVSSYSTNLYKAIHGNDVMKCNDVTKTLSEETVKIIGKQHIYNTVRNNFTIEELMDIVTEIKEDVIPNNRWLTLEQYVNILKKGLSKDLTDYNLFCITNLKGWIEAYRIKYMKAIGKQRSYKVFKNEQSYTNMTIVEKRRIKMRKFKEQLLAFKILLQNPTLINGVENNEDSKTQLRKAFERTLKIHQYQYGGGLDVVFDYLVRIGKITASIEEITKDIQFIGNDILNREGLKVSEAIENRFIVVSAKTDFIITFAKTIIESKETETFINEYIDGAFDKLKKLTNLT